MYSCCHEGHSGHHVLSKVTFITPGALLELPCLVVMYRNAQLAAWLWHWVFSQSGVIQTPTGSSRQLPYIACSLRGHPQAVPQQVQGTKKQPDSRISSQTGQRVPGVQIGGRCWCWKARVSLSSVSVYLHLSLALCVCVCFHLSVFLYARYYCLCVSLVIFNVTLESLLHSIEPQLFHSSAVEFNEWFPSF